MEKSITTITSKRLAELFHEFDSELKIDEYSIEKARLSKEQKAELHETLTEVLACREDFSPELFQTIQAFAKKAVVEAPDKDALWPSLVRED